jgi:hypothetical protein
VRRRSWSESAVRRWLILTLIVALVAAYFVTQQIVAGMIERRLITHGREVEARIEEVGLRRTTAALREGEQLTVTLSYPAANGEPRLTTGELVAEQAGTINVGDMITIRVDPDDPNTWTNRTRSRPWSQQLTAAIILLPLLALAGGMVWLRRRQVLRTWRDEPAMPAVVVETKQSAIAPNSRVVRFVLEEGDDRRVWSTLHPSSGAPRKGDPITVICAPSNPAMALMGELYQERT